MSGLGATFKGKILAMFVTRVATGPHHYDVISKCYGVTMTTRLVESERLYERRHPY